MSMIIRDISWYHSDRSLLFEHISFTIPSGWHVNLAGNNGSGKSTLMAILAGKLSPGNGSVTCAAVPYYLPQNYKPLQQSVAEALAVDIPMRALQCILSGDTAEEQYERLGDNWDIEERISKALAYWQLDQVRWNTPMSLLSGGEQTRVLLAGIALHQPAILLLDEPTNHLDRTGRARLYEFIRSYKGTLLVVSHDRKLLELNNHTLVLAHGTIEAYGGNYDFYKAQHSSQLQALQADIHEKEKELKAARKQAQMIKEKQQRQEGRDNRMEKKGGIPKIVANTMRNQSERSSARQNERHTRQLDQLAGDLQHKQASLDAAQLLQIRFQDSRLHQGKKLIQAIDLDFRYEDRKLWNKPLSFRLNSGERTEIRGANGSGKTTLLKLILGELQPASGSLERVDCAILYLDQQYSFIDGDKTVYEQLYAWNRQRLGEHNLKRYLHQYQLTAEQWDQKCSQLSGGEKMKLAICCLFIANEAPDLILLDEPGNNIDLNSQEILVQALKQYRGTLVLVTHDESFSEDLGIERYIEL